MLNPGTFLITFTRHPRRTLNEDFQPALLSSYDERLQLLGETGIDYCIPIEFTKEISQLSAHDFMKNILKDKFNVSVLLIGYDHRFGLGRVDGFAEYIEFGREMGMTVVQGSELDSGDYVSSSHIRELLQTGEVEKAAKYLTHNYSLSGKVVDGQKIGHTIGYPTANIAIDNPAKIIPTDGVYAAYTYLDGKKHKSMLYVGRRPTLFLGSNEKTIEVNILDFNENIYGKDIKVEFLRFIRRDAKFSNIEILKRQLMMDEERIRKYLASLD